MHWHSEKRHPLLVDSRVVDRIDEVFDGLDRSPAEIDWREPRKAALRDCVALRSGHLKSAIDSVYFGGKSLDESTTILKSSTAAVGQRRWWPRVWIPAAAALVALAGLALWKLGDPPSTQATLEPRWELRAASDADCRHNRQRKARGIHPGKNPIHPNLPRGPSIHLSDPRSRERRCAIPPAHAESFRPC